MKSPLADQGAGGAHFDGQGFLEKLPEPEQKPQPMALDQLFYKLGELYPQDSRIHTALVLARHEDLAHQFRAGQAANKQGAKPIFDGMDDFKEFMRNADARRAFRKVDSTQIFSLEAKPDAPRVKGQKSVEVYLDGKALAGRVDFPASKEKPPQDEIKFGDAYIRKADGGTYHVSRDVSGGDYALMRSDGHIYITSAINLNDPEIWLRVEDRQADEIKVGDRLKSVHDPREFTIVALGFGDGMVGVQVDDGTIQEISAEDMRSAFKRGDLKRLTPELQADFLMTREGE